MAISSHSGATDMGDLASCVDTEKVREQDSFLGEVGSPACPSRVGNSTWWGRACPRLRKQLE